MPLLLSVRGKQNVIRRVGGPEDVKKRLEALGFTVGCKITVVSELAGDLIVKVKDSRIALGRELANRIFV
ncbi:MAG: ferrous iron transport protein A [Treponema sp.]|jgi:ferrous iron transport protein A|nr:ferrous iron transport protein A [Treponema sp.]